MASHFSGAGAKGWRAEQPLTTSHNSAQPTYHRSGTAVECVPPLGFISGVLAQFPGNQTLLPTGLRQRCKVSPALILNTVSCLCSPHLPRTVLSQTFFLMHPKFNFFFSICVLCKPAKPQCVPPLEKLTLS